MTPYLLVLVDLTPISNTQLGIAGTIILAALALMFAYLRHQSHRPDGAMAGGNGKSGDKNVDWWHNAITDITRKAMKEHVDDRLRPDLEAIKDGQARVIELLQRIDMKLERRP